MSFLRSQPDLLRGFRAGDREALEKVYRAYLPRVTLFLRRGFVLKATGERVRGVSNPDDLADVLQEVFTRAFSAQARCSYDGLRDYGPYLTTVARNVIVSRYRARGREQRLLDPSALSESDIVEWQGDDETDVPWLDARSLEIARAYVSSLEDPLRSLHAARYVSALSQRDAARELGLSRPKIRKLESRLRRELQRLLAQAGLDVGTGVKPTTDSVETFRRWIGRPRTS